MPSRIVPLTTDAFLDAANGEPDLPENEPQKRSKPRASGLNGCIRQQFYDMTKTERTNPQHLDPNRRNAVVTQEHGRETEAYSARIIAKVNSPLVDEDMDGLRVVDRQIELPADYFVTGHPDGSLAQYRMEPTGEGRARQTAELRRELADGRAWGFEHKVYGSYQYKRILEGGIFKGKPDLLAQMLLYGDALDWDAATAVILSADSALIRGEMTRARDYAENGKTAKTREKYTKILEQYEGKDSKVYIESVFLEDYYGPFIPRLKVRAEALTEAVESGTLPVAERDPDVHPLCNYCDWKDRCVEDGPEAGARLPETPLEDS